MTSPHRKIAEQAAADAGDTPSAPCVACGSHATQFALRAFGARCRDCYASYCSEKRTYPDVGSRALSDRSWAYALRERAKRGERLSRVQLDAMREAIGRLVEHDDLAEACRADTVLGRHNGQERAA